MNKNLRFEEDTFYINSLIKKGENQHLDFKHKIDDARKIARAMAAFANASGGTLLIGVKDNGSITGVKTEEEWYMLQAAAEYYSKPKIPYTINLWKVDKKFVLEAIIYESKTKPHYVQNEKGKWTVYIRINDQNLVAEPIVVHLLKTSQAKSTKKIIIKAEDQKIMSLFKHDTELTFDDILRNSLLPYNIVKSVITRLVQIRILNYKLNTKHTFFFINDIELYNKYMNECFL
jgi:predicted HTH transcriptional regulator